MHTYSIEINILPQWKAHTIQSLFKEVWHAPKKLTHELRMNKSVTNEQTIMDWTKKLNDVENIKITFPIDTDYGVVPQNIPINVLYEDEHVLIVNKLAGMDTHPNEKNQTHTLANAVAGYYNKQGFTRKVRHVHRLDKGTTGAILFAKHPLSHAVLDYMLLQRHIHRVYIAIVDGLIHKKEGTINQPIGNDRHHATRRRVSKTGQQSITHYHLLYANKKKKQSVVCCKLDTGRTHQIRVHLSHLGYPLIGDTLYYGPSSYFRPALHARYMYFMHPFTQVNISCTAECLDKENIFAPYNLDIPKKFILND